jgi:methylenetetrahydrofolate dehydrogenase (NADP+) / methenyltetrahydrofolate cyclohydrolase
LKIYKITKKPKIVSFMATLIDGKKIAEGLRLQVKQQVSELVAKHGAVPCLAVILVGDDPASHVYVRNKKRACEEAGIKSVEISLPASVTQNALLAEIARLNADNYVHGILVQLPVPQQINPLTIIGAIDPRKDVDGFHVVNAGKLAVGERGLVPCTPKGCLHLLKTHMGSLAGKHAVVLGRSNIVGKPMAQLLLNESCTVTICHSKTSVLADEIRRADIVVAAIGKPEFVTGDMLKAGAVVIDVGINRLESGKLVGDVDFASASAVASAITPVPGGVGPMTIACLLENTLEAYERLVGGGRE